MSLEAFKWAASQTGLHRREKTILKEIGTRFNEKVRMAWPSVKRMSQDTEYSESSIYEALNVLEKGGYIKRVPAYDSWSGARTSNRYCLPLFDSLSTPPKSGYLRLEHYFDADGKSQIESRNKGEPVVYSIFD